MKNLKSNQTQGWHNTQVLLMLALFTSPVIAASSLAENTFQQGIKSFKQGDYSVAERLFSEARKQGYTSLQINYNLGVATFKQKKYDAAISHFITLVDHPEFSAIAHYNIGLSLERQGKADAAKKYFTLVANDASNEKIQYLAQTKLTEKQPAPVAKKQKKWSVYASFTTAYDDNVELIDKERASGKGDSYLQTYARALYKTDPGIRIYASLFDVNYRHLDQDDYRSFKGGIDYPFKLDKWLLTPALEYSESTLDTNDYQDITDYKLKARTRLGKDSLTLLYRYSNISAAERQYDHLDGWRQRIRADYRMPIDMAIWRFRYQFETNSREDKPWRSYSPDRHGVEANLIVPVKNNWDIIGKAAYRYSDYPEALGRSRSDNRNRYEIGAQYTFNDTWSIDAKYQYTDNRSNQIGDEYTRNVYQLSINGHF